ncbi:MAG: DinB family protein [Fimbriimonas sp.]
MRADVAETLRQVVEGDDFSSPGGLLRSIKASVAVVVPPGCPYSIATNVKHALLWQDLWLCRLRGERLPQVIPGKDFPEVTEAEWPEVRRRFVEGLDEALAIARRDPFTHGAKDDDLAVRTLLKIANHGAYHLGQVQLLKRMKP